MRNSELMTGRLDSAWVFVSRLNVMSLFSGAHCRSALVHVKTTNVLRQNERTEVTDKKIEKNW